MEGKPLSPDNDTTPGLNRFAVWLVLVVALLATGTAWHRVRSDVLDAAQLHFQRMALQLGTAISERMRHYELVLRGGVGMFVASRDVERDEWRRYIANLDLASSSPGIQGVGYAVRTPAPVLPLLEQRVREEGFTDFNVRPPGPRAEYVPIIYLEPFSDRNLRAFGYDMFSEPIRREAMERARDSGLPALSGKVTLVQETDAHKQAGTLLYLPVYRNDATPLNVAERRAALQGYVYAAFRMDNLMHGIFGNRPVELDFAVFDGDSDERSALLFDSSARDGLPPEHEPGELYLRTQHRLDIAGRTWTLRFDTTPAFWNSVDLNKPRLVLLGGLSTSILLVAIAWSLARTRSRALSYAREMTSALRTSATLQRAILESTDYAIISTRVDGAIELVNPAAERMLGYDASELAGRPLPEFFPDSELANRARQLAVDLGEPIEPGFETLVACARRQLHDEHEWNLRQRGGGQLPVLLAVTALRSELGEISGFLGVAQDFTERRRAAQAARQFTIELEQRVEERTQALAQINLQLEAEIAERRHAEQRLQKAYTDLQVSMRAVQRHAREVAILREMGDLLQTCANLQEIGEVIERFAVRLFEHEAGGLYLFKSSRNVLEAIATWGELPAGDAVFAPEACWALRRSKPHIVTAGSRDVSCQHVSTAQSYLCIPLSAQGELIGLLHLRATDTHDELDERMSCCTSAAEVIGLAMANFRLRERLREQSIHDDLTGLFNRRYLENTLDREESRAARAGSTLGILMLDIDHFKQLNDTWGHKAGDLALRAVGRLLSALVRNADIATRYGGEEFVIVLPDAAREACLRRAEEIRQRIAEAAATSDPAQNPHPLTVSIGVALFPQHGEHWQAVLLAADQALYQAKKLGRNRVVEAPAPSADTPAPT